MHRLISSFLAVTLGCATTAGWDNPDAVGDAGLPKAVDGALQATDGRARVNDAGIMDAAVGDETAVDNTDYNTPTVCSTGTYWTQGDSKSDLMHPGVACKSCHVLFGAGKKEFDISGTVYATAHEPNDCNGSGATTVVITDAKNVDHVLNVNAAGNFYNDDAYSFIKIATPYTAKVVNGSQTREMISSQTNGDCNSCHDETGNQLAPGRIMAP